MLRNNPHFKVQLGNGFYACGQGYATSQFIHIDNAKFFDGEGLEVVFEVPFAMFPATLEYEEIDGPEKPKTLAQIYSESPSDRAWPK